MNMHYLLLCLLCVLIQRGTAQSSWPSESWANAVNLSTVLDPLGADEASGMHWNPVNNRLYFIQNNGELKVLQLNTVIGSFSRITAQTLSGGPEGITQVDYAADEFYVIDENSYRIQRYMHTAAYANMTLANYWNLLIAPSPMTNTGNTGPEGIVFVPDTFLSAIGFVSSVTGQTYTSVKGLGGLLFIAHQAGGYVWAFDINPSVTNDFAYVGKYKTNNTESCDLSFDRSTGLLYILHNASVNTLEVTDMKTDTVGSELKFTTLKEYAIPNPSGSVNIEGFAITPKCADTANVSVWLCRDVSDVLGRLDCLRWFNSFSADGECENLISASGYTPAINNLSIYYNRPSEQLLIQSDENILSFQIYNSTGEIASRQIVNNPSIEINTSLLGSGVFYVVIETAKARMVKKFTVVR